MSHIRRALADERVAELHVQSHADRTMTDLSATFPLPSDLQARQRRLVRMSLLFARGSDVPTSRRWA